MRETFSFRLVLEGSALEVDVLDRLWECGCDDAVIGEERGVKIADFDRSAPTFEAAVLSAVHAIETADVGLITVRVEPDDLVTASEIAQRTGRTRQSIAQIVAGLRRSGDFPSPLTTGHGKTRVWRWTDVQAWFAKAGECPPFDERCAHFVAALNGALEFRRHASAFGAKGGASIIIDSLEDIARVTSASTTDEPPYATGSADTEALWSLTATDRASCYRALRDDVRRTQSHWVFLVTSGLSELSHTLSLESPQVAKWLWDAVQAHDRAFETRLAGNVEAAQQEDFQVAVNSARILRELQVPDAVSQARSTTRYALYTTRDGISISQERPPLPRETPAYGACIHEARLIVILDQLWVRGRQTPTGTDVLRDVAYELLTHRRTDRRHLCYWHHDKQGSAKRALTKMQDATCERLRLDYRSDTGPWATMRSAWVPHLGLHDSPDARNHNPGDPATVVEESRLLLFVSSWTLASTVRLLAERYTPVQVAAVDDVIHRIERELGVNSA